MTNLTETSNFDANVRELETTDYAIGGAGGVANSQAQALANRTQWLKAQVAALVAEIVTLAPLASPGFTGEPTAPTPAAGDNSTNVATTAFVRAALGGIAYVACGGGSNVVLVAAQYGLGILVLTGGLTANINVVFPNGITGQWIVSNRTTGPYTITCTVAGGSGVVVSQGAAQVLYGDGSNIGRGTDWINVALIGSPTAPTPAAGDNSTNVATTAFVATALANLPVPQSASTYSYSSGGTGMTVSVSFTTPCAGTLIAFGGRNNSSAVTTGSGSDGTLYVNGTEVRTDHTEVSIMHSYSVSLSAGQAVSAAYAAYAPVDFTASVLLIFIPNT
jgi:hypothetical protein